MKTLLLDRTKWDLCLDASNNIAVADNPYSTAQDAASAIRLFKGEYWYDINLGVPYFEQILGKRPTVEYMRSQFKKAALSVPDIATARVAITSLKGRVLTGQVTVTDVAGKTQSIVFTSTVARFDQSDFDQATFS